MEVEGEFDRLTGLSRVLTGFRFPASPVAV